MKSGAVRIEAPHHVGMEDIRAEAERLLARLQARSKPTSLGYLFPPTPGVPVPVDEWVSETGPDEGGQSH